LEIAGEESGVSYFTERQEEKKMDTKDVKNGVFWDVTPSGSCKNRRFRGT
jgi:hypothetical protein